MSELKAQQLFDELINNPNVKKIPSGENWAWHAAAGADLFTSGYRVWGTTDWIDLGLKYYDHLLANLVKDPDGYYSTFMPLEGRPDLWLDAEVTDALILNPALKMAELVLNDPDLKPVYGQKAQHYIDFTKKHMIEKWEHRGLWHECGEYGNYIFGTMFLTSPDAAEWTYTDEIAHPYMSNKYNISNKLGETHLLLWRLTGDGYYRDKAEKLFYRMKSDIQHFDGHYRWNYWNPYYEKDVYPEKNGTVHWVGVHPYRSGYQAAEVGQIVEAYHNGVVFDEEDLKAIIKTNLKIMWNGDEKDPRFKNSNGQDPQPVKDRGWRQEQALMNRGQLWTSLAGFDPVIGRLREAVERDSTEIRARVGRAYTQKCTAGQPVSFKRKYVEQYGLPVKVKEVAGGNSALLTITSVIPHIITGGKKAVLFCKVEQPGEHGLEVALYERDGNKRLGTLFKGTMHGHPDGLRGFHMVEWNGTDPAGQKTFKGPFTVRWTVEGGGHSDCWVEIG